MMSVVDELLTAMDDVKATATDNMAGNAKATTDNVAASTTNDVPSKAKVITTIERELAKAFPGVSINCIVTDGIYFTNDLLILIIDGEFAIYQPSSLVSIKVTQRPTSKQTSNGIIYYYITNDTNHNQPVDYDAQRDYALVLHFTDTTQEIITLCDVKTKKNATHSEYLIVAADISRRIAAM